jgi:hypothetical protein
VIALRILKFYNNINNLDSYLESDLESVPRGFEVLPPPAPPVVKNNRSEATEDKKLVAKRDVSKEGGEKVEIGERVKGQEKTNTLQNLKETKSAEELLQPETSSLANELEKMLQDYTEGTLEYKTILQEIKRLKLF